MDTLYVDSLEAHLNQLEVVKKSTIDTIAYYERMKEYCQESLRGILEEVELTNKRIVLARKD